MQTKYGTARVLFSSEHICINQEEDIFPLVEGPMPRIKSRLFEGAWAGFVREEGLDGDNGILFHDAVGIDSHGEIQTKISIDRGTGITLHAFPEIILRGSFLLQVEVFDLRQVYALKAFLKAFDDGFIRIGAKRTVHGRCRIKQLEWVDCLGGQVRKTLPKPTIPLVATPHYDCVNGHHQRVSVRLRGGQCHVCLVDVPPEWYVERQKLMANTPAQSQLRMWGDRTPLLGSVEEILDQLGIQMPIDSSRAYTPLGAISPEFDVMRVNARTLRRFLFPKLPWNLADCPRWRARLDVFVGLAIFFTSQGLAKTPAVTAAAVMHRLLTGFRLTRENSGDWRELIGFYAENGYHAVWQRIQQAGGNVTFQQIAQWTLEEFQVETSQGGEENA